MWTAVCDALGLVTEADSYEQLIEKAWEVVPELIEFNAIDVAGEIRLQFKPTANAILRQAGINEKL